MSEDNNQSPVEKLDAVLEVLRRLIDAGDFGKTGSKALRSAARTMCGVRNLAHIPEALDRQRLAAGEGRHD